MHLIFDSRRRLQIAILITMLVSGVIAAHPGNALAKTGPVRMIPENFTALAEMVSPAVVNIRTVKTVQGGGPVFRHFWRGPGGENDQFREFFEKFFGEDQQRDFKQRSLGSGFFIDDDGYLVTNNHVVEGADEIIVILRNEDEYPAKVVGRDPNTDLALLKITSGNNFPVARLGNSEAIKVGEWVVAIGSPFGLEHTVTAGIVSAKGRVIGSGPYDDFIQTDASINPGNSGGPLLNLAGEVVGINTAIIASGQGIGFAIPINLARNVIEQLKESGEVTRGWLGVGIQPLSKEMGEYYGITDGKGVMVSQVFPGDPADNAGIQPKDIILEVNGVKIEDSRDLTRLIAGLSVGSTAKVKVLRGKKTKTFRVKIAKRDEKRIASRGTGPQEQEHELGIRVSELTPELRRRFNLDNEQGVIVVGVEQGSAAAKAGLQSGDLIKEVNHQVVDTVADFDAAIEKAEKGDAIQLFIRRMNMGFLVIKITK